MVPGAEGNHVRSPSRASPAKVKGRGRRKTYRAAAPRGRRQPRPGLSGPELSVAPDHSPGRQHVGPATARKRAQIPRATPASFQLRAIFALTGAVR